MTTGKSDGEPFHGSEQALPQSPRRSGPRLAALGSVLVVAIAAVDALLGPRVILLELLIVGPCCGVRTHRAVLTAALGLFTLVCSVAVAVPDAIWLTPTQLAFTLGIGVVSLVATLVAALIECSQHHVSL